MSVPPFELRPLRLDDEVAFRRALKACDQDPSIGDFALGFKDRRDFPGYVRNLEQWSRGENLPDSWVESSFYVGVSEGTIIGRLSFRHKLTESLLLLNGHIGYAVISEFRGRGYATAFLQKGLQIAAARGLDRVLITCDETNLASKRVIEKCGGVFENIATDPRTDARVLRYWIKLPAPDHPNSA